jgi:hypothetical protein
MKQQKSKKNKNRIKKRQRNRRNEKECFCSLRIKKKKKREKKKKKKKVICEIIKLKIFFQSFFFFFFMSTPGKYFDDRNTLIILSEDGSCRAKLEMRKMASNGHYRDDYELVHDDGFPVTELKIAEGTEVMRNHFFGPSEKTARSRRECPASEIFKKFTLERNFQSGSDRYVLKCGEGSEEKKIHLKFVANCEEENSKKEDEPAFE